MKRTAVVFLVLVLASSAAAQEVKLFGGADWARYLNLRQYPFEDYEVFRTNPGILAGIGLELSLKPMLGADVGLLYFQKGTTADVYLMESPIGLDVYNLDVISLPACLKFKPFPKFPAYFLAGGEISFVLSHHSHFTSAIYGAYNDDLTPETRRFDFGIVAGGGLEFAAAPRWSVFTEVRYFLGLVNLQKSEPFKTRALAAQVGVKYSLKAKSR